jgi:asparagine N-glycosylation enzyme membrane subunit Stt3
MYRSRKVPNKDDLTLTNKLLFVLLFLSFLLMLAAAKFAWYYGVASVLFSTGCYCALLRSLMADIAKNKVE